jgi:23S rRNA pseudouridine1911/1915/1917 synthase
MHHEPRIIYEDNHLLIIDKPSGWIVQGASPDDDSLLEWGKSYLKQQYDKPGNVYLAAVSRLDRLVSGVVPLARTSKSAARLNAQIAARSVKKNYIAVVSPVPRKTTDRLRHYLVRDERLARSQAFDESRAGATEAILEYKVVEVSDRFETPPSRSEGRHKFALIEIDLVTGRKHQIRAQLAAIGCSIVGDKKYGSQVMMQNGIALHAWRFECDHPTMRVKDDDADEEAQRMSFSCQPPKSWNNLQLDLKAYQTSASNNLE